MPSDNLLTSIVVAKKDVKSPAGKVPLCTTLYSSARDLLQGRPVVEFPSRFCLQRGRAATVSQLPTVYYFGGCVCARCRVTDASYRA